MLKICQKFLPNYKKYWGFTLAELLVVIAIIAIIATIVFAYLASARAKARDARRQSDIRQIHLAMEVCYDKENCGPGAAKYLVTGTCGSPPCPNDVDAIDADKDPLYIDVPLDPVNSGDRRYTWIAGSDQYYCLYVKLEEAQTPTWFCGSNKGVDQKDYPSGLPIKDDCCGFDVDN